MRVIMPFSYVTDRTRFQNRSIGIRGRNPGGSYGGVAVVEEVGH